MKDNFVKLGLFFVGITIACYTFAQDSSRFDQTISFPDKLFSALDKKTSSVEGKLTRQTTKYLNKCQRQEDKIRRKLWKKDSSLAKQLFNGVDEKYDQLKSTTGNVGIDATVYSGHLDSLSTALNLLKNQSISDHPALQKTLAQYGELQSKINTSETIRKYIVQRRELLKQQFEKLGMVKELKRYRKQVYYYEQQIREYKQVFEDPSKAETKLMEIAMHIPQFKDFFAKKSMLGGMFALPGSGGTTSLASLQGLQTRALISQSLTDRFGKGPDVTKMMQQSLQNAQGQLGQLKNKVSSFSEGHYGDVGDDDIPGFKPNDEKTRSLKDRLEYGANVQTQKARYFFPVTSDIALSFGYKINSNSSFGVGASYKLGWGNNWNSVRLSHQGIGLRSYLDWKIKGAFYLSGGYEQNYRSVIKSIDQLQNYSEWQASGLVGITKKYSINKKMKAEMKLLWDFMSYQQLPKTQPVLFRIGYSLK